MGRRKTPKSWDVIPMQREVVKFKARQRSRAWHQSEHGKTWKAKYMRQYIHDNHTEWLGRAAKWRRENPGKAAQYLERLHANRARYDVAADLMRQWRKWAYYYLLANHAKPGCTGHCKSPHFRSYDKTPKVWYHRRICAICLEIMDHLDCPCCHRATERTSNYADFQRHRWGEAARQDHILVMCE